MRKVIYISKYNPKVYEKTNLHYICFERNSLNFINFLPGFVYPNIFVFHADANPNGETYTDP